MKTQDIEVSNFKEHKDGSATFQLITTPAIDKILRREAKKAKLSVEKFVVKMITDYVAMPTEQKNPKWNM